MRMVGTLLLSMFVGVGCGGSSAFRDAVRGRAASTMSCAARDIRVSELGGGGWLATGCGQRQSFTCVTTRTSWARDVVCTPDSPLTATGSGASREVAASSRADDDEVIHAIAADCRIDRAAVVVVHITADGRPERAETGALTGAMGTCVMTGIHASRFLPRPSPEVARVEVSPAIAGLPAVVTTEPTPPASSAAETAARAQVDALRDVILACTSSSATAVVAEWTAAGVLTLHLPDARAGTPEDGCIRSLGTGLSISPAPGTAGSVLHGVH